MAQKPEHPFLANDVVFVQPKNSVSIQVRSSYECVRRLAFILASNKFLMNFERYLNYLTMSRHISAVIFHVEKLSWCSIPYAQCTPYILVYPNNAFMRSNMRCGYYFIWNTSYHRCRWRHTHRHTCQTKAWLVAIEWGINAHFQLMKFETDDEKSWKGINF